MRSAEPRSATASKAQAKTSFFSKESDGHFFGPTVQQKPFFPAPGSRPAVQAKLNIGRPDDHYEKEADSVADKVVQRLSEPAAVQMKSLAPASVTPLVQQKCADSDKDEKLEKKEQKPDSAVQRKPIFESNAEMAVGGPEVQSKCDACDNEEHLQKKGGDGTPSTVGPSVESSLSASRGTGNPMPERIRQDMEGEIGADFSGVRIHTGATAERMSKDLNAQAFTHGNDIYFNSGKFDTTTRAGKHLLAHELTHTIQQGKSASGYVKRKALTTSTESLIQRAPGSPAAGQPAESKIQGPPYKKDGYSLEVKDKITEMVVPKVSLPAFKDRNKAKFHTHLGFMAGRINSSQIPRWNTDVKSDVETSTQTFLDGKSKALKTGVYYFKSESSDLVVFGKAQQLKANFKIPDWDRKGQPRNHSVDHIVELQLGGGDGPDNYELLDTLANSAIGSVLQKEIYDRIKAGRQFFIDNNVPNVPAREEFVRADQPTAIVFFEQVDQWNLLPGKGDPNMYWSITEVKSGVPLQHLRAMTLDEIHKLDGSDKSLHLFVKPNEGIPHTIDMPAKKKDNWLPGINLLSAGISNPAAADDAVMGNISIELKADLAKKLNAPAQINLDFTKAPGLVNAGALVFSGVTEKLAGLFSFRGLSPIKVSEFDLTDRGLVINGVITADNPLIQGASIDFSVMGNDITFSKTFSSGEIKGFPSPFKITDISLVIFASSEFGFGLSGGIDFEIKDFGKGSINGKAGSKEGFVLAGDFSFDKEAFEGKVHVEYKRGFDDKEGAWSYKGELRLGKGKKIKGIESLSVAISGENGIISGTGSLKLTLKTIDEIVLKLKVEGENLSIEGDLSLKKMPKLKAGTAKFILTKTAGDWDLSLSGSVEPDLKIAGLSLDEIKGEYHKGVFDVSAKGTYSRGKISGSFQFGITNKLVKDGRKVEREDVEPGPALVFYADGKLNVQIVDGVSGTINVTVTPDGDFKIGGKIELTEDKYIVKPKGDNRKDNPALNLMDPFHRSIPLASCGIATVNLGLAFGVGLFYAFEGLKFDKGTNLTIAPTSLIDTGKIAISSEILMSTGIKAGVDANIDVTLDLGVLIAKLEVLGGVNLTFTAVEASAMAKILADFSIEKGVEFKSAAVNFTVESSLSYQITLGIRIFLDLLFKEFTLWRHQWEPEGLNGKRAFPLFDGTLNLNTKFGENNSFDLKQVADGVKDPLKAKASKQETYEAAGKRAINEDGPTAAEKTEESKQTIRKDLNESYRGAYSASVFAFNQTINKNYFDKRTDLWNRIQGMPNLNEEIRQAFITDIRRYEFEEYDAISAFLIRDTSFDENARSIIVGDFLKYRYTLGSGERTNLQSLIKVSPNGQKGKSDKGASVQKQEQNGITGTGEHPSHPSLRDDEFEEKLDTLKGHGAALPLPIREEMEHRIGADFSQVKIHDNPESRELSNRVHAHAFTCGNDIFFNAGKFDTTSKSGQLLLAHELTHVVQQEGDRIQAKIQRQEIAKTLVNRKTQADLFGSGVLPGMRLSDFKQYTTDQSDWFEEATLTKDDRDDLWKILRKTRKDSPVISGVGDVSLSLLRTVTDAQWEDLEAYCKACDSRFHTVRLVPSGTLPERFALGNLLKTLETAIAPLVLEKTISELQLKRIQSEGLLIPLIMYFLTFKPHLQETIASAAALDPGVKSETELLLNFVKNPGMLPYLPLFGKVRNLHRFSTVALDQLKANFSDFTRKKPLYLVLYSGNDYDSAFLRSQFLFENLIKDKTKLVLMLEGQASIADITAKVPGIGKDYGMTDGKGANQIAQVIIAGHGSSRSMELAGTGEPEPVGAGQLNYNAESLDLDNNAKNSDALIRVLAANMNPATARIVYAACLVGSTVVPNNDPKTKKPYQAADIAREVNNPGRESLVAHTRKLAPGTMVEGGRSSVGLGSAKSLQDATGGLHISYDFDPDSFGSAIAYVATGKEPEGLMRSAVEVAATNAIAAANQLRLRVGRPPTGDWYDAITLVFAREALDGVAPGAPVSIVRLNQLANMASAYFELAWSLSGTSELLSRANIFPAIAAKIYAATASLPDMNSPANPDAERGRLTLELAWAMMSRARAANVIAYLDGRPSLRPAEIKPALEISTLDKQKMAGSLFPPAAAPSAGRIRLAIAWIEEDDANPAVKSFLDTQVDTSGTRPRLMPVVRIQLGNAAEEDRILDLLGRLTKTVKGADGREKPAANADAYPEGSGPAMNDVRIRENIYEATVISPAYVLNVRRQPSMDGNPFAWLHRGDKVNVMGFVDGWAALDINGVIGFAYGTFLSKPPFDATGEIIIIVRI